MKLRFAAFIAFIAPSLVFAEDGAMLEGDPAAGEAAFRQCQACHMIVDDAGNTIAGRGARTGPNLYGVIGRTAGSVDGFRYGPGLRKLNQEELVWDKEQFISYIQNPTGFVREYLGESRVRSNMSFMVRDEQQAYDLYAYLSSISTAEE